MNMSASTPNTEADTAAEDDVLDIAVGIVQAADGRVLIAQRRAGTMGAGYWEFPGGKHEPGETMQATLVRELQEELGITPLQPQHLIRMRNPAAMRPVRLHVWLVTDWQGRPYGREGQRIEWCQQANLTDWKLLPGNRALLNALALPPRIAIVVATAAAMTVTASADLLCLTAPALDDDAYAELARSVLAHVNTTGTTVLLDRDAAMVRQLGAGGLYWSARQAAAVSQRPLGPDYLLAVATVGVNDLRAACRIEADFAVLAQTPFVWSAWQRERADFGLPVYALAAAADSGAVDVARAHNAHGIAVSAG